MGTMRTVSRCKFHGETMNTRWLVALMVFGGCEPSGGDGGSAVIIEVDAGPSEPMGRCNMTTRRLEYSGPMNCAAEPEIRDIVDQGRPFQIFAYEASHPLATADKAFPCARSTGESYEAADEVTEPCSMAGVRPWHSVRWADANRACESIGWRLCSSDELGAACGGDAANAFCYGPTFRDGACNVRESYRDPMTMVGSEAPTGYFDECVTPDSVHDLTGNVWEWTNDRDDQDGRARYYQAAGWKTLAERHRDIDQECTVIHRLPGLTAPSYLQPYVGFRCCRDQPD